MKDTNPSPKVFAIGLDGGTFDIMDPWIERGDLPNIKGLIERGTKATLKSVILPFTPQAWSSFMTGMNPGNHGVFGFKEKVDGKYSFQLVNNRNIRSKTLWRYLSDYGKKVIAVNIPMTYPPEEVNGIMIGGMDSPGIGSDFTYPSSIRQEVLDVAKDYVIHLHVGAGYLDSDRKRREAVDALIRMVESREKLILHLMGRYPWDLFAVNFSAIDQAQHHFWKYMDASREFGEVILKVHKRIDEAVGSICERMPPGATVYVMSDHGSGPASPYVFFVDEWLRQRRLLSFKDHFSLRGLAAKSTKWALSALSQKLSSGQKDSLMRLLPGMRVKSQGYMRRALIDWPNTKVFSGEHPSTLRINLRGRDEEGTVEPREYESLRDRLIGELESLTCPETDEELIEKVYKREAIYHGDYLPSAPDLIIHPKYFSHQVKGGPFPNSYYRQVISRKNPKEFFVNGVHRLDGIFIGVGPGIKGNHAITPLNIIDLFPTILYSLDMEIPEIIDGRVAREMFGAEYLLAHPIRFSDSPMNRWPPEEGAGASYGRQESLEIEERLRGLGYLD